MEPTSSKRKGDQLWEIKKYKGQHTSMNPLMNRDHQQLDILYISTLIRQLVRPELSILVTVIHTVVICITGSYSYTG